MWFFTKKINELIEKKIKENLTQYKSELKNLEKKIDTAVSQEFKQIQSEVDLLPSEMRSNLTSLSKDMDQLTKDVKKLQGKTFKAQGIEKIIHHSDYSQNDKDNLANIAKTQFNLHNYQLSRLFFPIKVSKKNTYFKVNSNCAIALKGLKFVEGDGWGRYRINRGANILCEFSKSKLVPEEGILINHIYYYPDDIMNITQIQGEGEIQVELLGYKVTPMGFLYPLSEYE
jgi:hypothetical protein